MKSIEQCLDIVLEQLAENWNKPNNERTHLKGEKLLESFKLPDKMRKHEFYKRLIRKLIRDEYAETTDENIVLTQNTDISIYDKETIITIEGFYLITEKGGYVKEDSKKRIAEFPKTYWFIIAAIAFIVGLFTDVAKKAISQMLLPDKQKLEQAIPASEYNGQTHKNHLYHRLDTFYIVADTFFIRK